MVIAVLKTEAQFAGKTGKVSSSALTLILPARLSTATRRADTLLDHSQQPQGLVAITKATYARGGVGAFYSGVGALVAGNSLKAGVRFLAYDKFKQALVDSDVST